jgi:hypothetical protein
MRRSTASETLLQEAVERIAARTGRPAVVEDTELRLLAHSMHESAPDAVRAASILARGASPDVRRYLLPLMRTARRPLRIAGSDSLALQPRLCVPVLWRGTAVAYLWFVDPGEEIDEVTARWCASELSHVAAALADVAESGTHPDRRRLLFERILDFPFDAAAAGDELERSGAFARHAALVVAQLLPRPRTPGDDGELAVHLALGYAHSGLRQDQTLASTRAGATTVLISASSPAAAHSSLDRIRTVLDAGFETAIGVAHVRAAYDEVSAAGVEAALAARAARAIPGVGEVVEWDDLGHAEPFVRLAAAQPDQPLHPALARLSSQSETELLLETLETYLDSGCNAQQTSLLLNLHRTSLYHRIRRIEEIAGVDLHEGVQRTALHLAVKTARLSGSLPAATRVAPPHPIS